MVRDSHVESPPRYHVGARRLRYWANWAVMVPVTALFAGLGILVSLVDRSGDRTHAIARTWGRILLRVAGIRLEVEGLERLEAADSYVFVANHHSALDIPALLAGLPYSTRMLAKSDLFAVPFLGWYIARVGYVPVERDDPRRVRKVLRSALEGAERGVSLVVFPEGTRSPEGRLQEFKRGAVLLARESGLPIVPVALVNSGRLMPPGDLHADPGIIAIRVGEPVVPAEHGPSRQLAALLRQRVLELTRADRVA